MAKKIVKASLMSAAVGAAVGGGRVAVSNKENRTKAKKAVADLKKTTVKTATDLYKTARKEADSVLKSTSKKAPAVNKTVKNKVSKKGAK